jgi:hypothetical protein
MPITRSEATRLGVDAMVAHGSAPATSPDPRTRTPGKRSTRRAASASMRLDELLVSQTITA